MPLRNRFCTSDACCADAICSADGSRPLSDFNIQHYYILWLQRNPILCELPTAVHTTGILYFADVHRILVWLWCRAWTPNREKQFRWVVSAGETNCIFRGIWEAWEHERNWRALATCNNNIVQKKIWRSPWHRYWHSTRWMFYGGIIEARDTRNKSKHRAEMQCTLHALSASRVSRPPPSSCCGWLTRNHLFVSRAAMLLSGQHHFEFTAF